MMRGGGDGLIYHHAPFHEAQSLSQNENTAKARASFTFRPTPSRRLFLISKSHIVPRPRAEGGAGCETDLRLRALIRFAVITSPRPVSLARRSFDYSKLTCGSSVPFRPASSLIRYDGRGEAWRAFSASRQRRSRHPLGLRSCVPLSAHPIRETGR